MEITIHLGEPFWRTTGSRRVRIRLDENATVSDALAELGQLFPEFGRLIRGEETQNPGGLGPLWQLVQLPLPVYVLVNRRLAHEASWDKTELHDGDRLYVIVPTVGG